MNQKRAKKCSGKEVGENGLPCLDYLALFHGDLYASGYVQVETGTKTDQSEAMPLEYLILRLQPANYPSGNKARHLDDGEFSAGFTGDDRCAIFIS